MPSPVSLHVPATSCVTLGTGTPVRSPGDEIIDVKSSGRGRKQHVILSQFPTRLWGQQAPLTQADALETLSMPHGPLPQGQSRKVTQGGGWTSGHWSLLQGQEPLGRKHHISLILFWASSPLAVGGWGWGRGPAIFLHNLPLGVGDGCGRLLGVAKPIFHMQSKVILI